ncbi:hypothetical protein [Oceanimonas sp. GK1]|uniref:hypothetical protein n=1 Tax=Oceanimonas sp. (strain GK1 / IBRC-M 10197) TaxID=511062 RepID=UPI0011D245A2|nr:hypothetical protein [Oceanimonas sp. GK1]
MSISYTKKRLYRVGLHPLGSALEDVKQLAYAVWYRGYQPTQTELERLRDVMTCEQFQRVLCVLELLSQYPVCYRENALYLQKLTHDFHSRLMGDDTPLALGRYSPSKRWGLKDTTASLRQALLPLQTRTYADATGRQHGLSA